MPGPLSIPIEDDVVSVADITRKEIYGTMAYQKEYCKIAFDLLSQTDECNTKSHVCRELICGKQTLIRWMRKYPEFNKAIVDGLAIGAAHWREKIREHAFDPTSSVNNGLIKLLSSSVYGIKEDIEPTVIIHNTQNNADPEAELKKRGIPVPVISASDIEEEEG